MTKNDIVNELNKMGYEVREENGIYYIKAEVLKND